MKHKGKFSFHELVTDGKAIGRVLALEMHPTATQENYLIAWDHKPDEEAGHRHISSPDGHYSWSEASLLHPCKYPIIEDDNVTEPGTTESR